MPAKFGAALYVTRAWQVLTTEGLDASSSQLPFVIRWPSAELIYESASTCERSSQQVAKRDSRQILPNLIFNNIASICEYPAAASCSLVGTDGVTLFSTMP